MRERPRNCVAVLTSRRLLASPASRRQHREIRREAVLLFDRATLLRLWNALRHPPRRRRPLQIVVEELLHPLLEVLLILFLCEMVRLAGIRQQDHLLAPAPRGAVQLEALVPIHGVVGRAVKNQEWRRDVAYVVDR